MLYQYECTYILHRLYTDIYKNIYTISIYIASKKYGQRLDNIVTLRCK